MRGRLGRSLYSACLPLAALKKEIDDFSVGNFGAHIHAELPEMFGNNAGRAVLAVRKLGMLMGVAVPCDDLLLHLGASLSMLSASGCSEACAIAGHPD